MDNVQEHNTCNLIPSLTDNKFDFHILQRKEGKKVNVRKKFRHRRSDANVSSSGKFVRSRYYTLDFYILITYRNISFDVKSLYFVPLYI
jgi:hypothetical protein